MTSKRLLIVDDEAEICELIRQIAEEQGFEVFTTDKRPEFEEACLSFKPSVIFLDVVMPEVDGITLVRDLADQRCTAKVVIISGYGDRYIRNAVQIGSALGLANISGLAKPLSHDDVIAALED